MGVVHAHTLTLCFSNHFPGKTRLSSCLLETRGFGVKFYRLDTLADANQEKYTLGFISHVCVLRWRLYITRHVY